MFPVLPFFLTRCMFTIYIYLFHTASLQAMFKDADAELADLMKE